MLAQVKDWIKNSRLSPLRGIVTWHGKESDTIYLTFDDGPHPEYTKTILDALSRHGVKATFFFLGEMVAQNMEIVLRTHTEGHTIGNHGYDHHVFSHPFSRKDFNDLEKTDLIIRKFSGSKPLMIRPPYGKMTLTLLLSSILKKQLIVMWSFDSRDSFVKTDLELLQTLQSVRGGDILLFHDDTPVTVRNIDTILTTLKKRGFRFSSLHGLLPENWSKSNG